MTNAGTRRSAPRLPLEGSLDLTYRCNNRCLHCWSWRPHDGAEVANELTFGEIRTLADDARAFGCRRWAISGGEPMLRADFAEIFDYLTRKCLSYTLNTNGSLITPEIARLLTRKGAKLVALYGATSQVHDRITRNPGSFESTLRGFAYLKEAGAHFVVQLVPLRDNHGQWPAMVSLAQSLSPHYRVGAPWLHLSAGGEVSRNREIAAQRLDPATVVELDRPGSGADGIDFAGEGRHGAADGDRLFAACIASRREFHVDPYGQMTFCALVRDPALRYNLRQGTFREGWEEFIPALADRVRGGDEYRRHCGACDLRSECRWCAVYGYLEHRRHSAKVDYLCAVARESRRFKERLLKEHCRYFDIAGITVQVQSDLPIGNGTFDAKFVPFEVDAPGPDTISVHHHFGLPDLDGRDIGQEVYRKPPWAIYRKGSSWIYLGIAPEPADPTLHRVAVFDAGHTHGRIYHPDERALRGGGLQALTLLPTDQILLARVLADRQGCYLHSSGVSLGGEGLLFVGHSEAGKSTMVTMLQDEAEILCDDRVIVRRWPEGFRIHGTWSHGDVPTVSNTAAPLRGLFFLEKSDHNRLIPMTDRHEILRRLLVTVIKPLVTSDWWEKTLDVVEKLAREVPAYRLQFDRSGQVVALLKESLVG